MKYAAALLLLLLIASCLNNDKKTTLAVIDDKRHYFPILQGQELKIVVKIVNTGENTFELKDMFTSCGCVTVEQSSIETILPGKEGMLVLKYNSNKNIGLVEHFITIYGNLKNEDKIEIQFDTHVVPDALYTKDYEELFSKDRSVVGEMVDGKENNKGYYVDGN